MEGGLFADTSNILNKYTNHPCRLLIVHYVRHTAVHTAELVVTGRSVFGDETAMENLESYKRQINFQQN